MLIVISPAKTLDFEHKAHINYHSKNDFLKQSAQLINTLKHFSAPDLGKLMSISPKLAQLNVERYATWSLPFTANNAKQALLAFKGDVYTGLDAETLTEEELMYAQDHLRILSGLYGVLRPLDLIQPYRLEMGTKLAFETHDNLYQFWGDSLTKNINKALKAQGDEVLINLASNEYFKAVHTDKLAGQIVTPVFKDFKNGQYKMISFYAKKARGLMSRYIIKNKVTTPEALIHFDYEGYYYSESESSANELVFLRG